MAELNPNEIAYIAGLFDGEGCVTCKQKPTKRKDRGGKVYNQWYIRCEIKKTQTLQKTMALVLRIQRRFSFCKTSMALCHC